MYNKLLLLRLTVPPDAIEAVDVLVATVAPVASSTVSDSVALAAAGRAFAMSTCVDYKMIISVGSACTQHRSIRDVDLLIIK